MPRKRGGICSCFGGDTPEITIDLDNVQLQQMEADEPMPPLEELDAKFEELVAELDLPEQHRQRMYSLPPEKKWQIYCSKRREQDDPNSAAFPDTYLDRLKAMMNLVLIDEDEIQNRTKLVDSLKTALRTQPMRFVMRFLDLDGLSVLLEFLEKMDYETMESPIHTSAIGCFKALMNNSIGRANVLAHPTAINTLSQSLCTENIKTKIQVLEILGGVCLVPGGHKKVLDAMCHYQKYASERTRFQRLVNDLDRSTGKYREETNLKTAVMSFINAVIKCGAGEDSLEFRVHLRYEFLMLGLQPVIDKMRSLENATLDRHLDFFELIRNEDERDLARRYDMVHVDSKNAISMFDTIKKKLAHSEAYPHFMSVLQHFLLLPNHGRSIHHWSLINQLLQQIVLQYDSGQDPDIAPFDINFKDVIEKVINQNLERQKLADEKEKECEELKAELLRKDREIEGIEQAKEEAMNALHDMQDKQQRQAKELEMVKKENESLMLQINELKAMNGTNVPDDAKLSGAKLTSSPAPIIPAPPPPPGGGGPPAPPPPPGMFVPAPPPPPGSGGAPPPPPPGMGMPGMPGKKRKNNLPKPSNPLKSFNWAKLPDRELANTVWMDVDENKIIKHVDFDEFDKTFSAYQKTRAEDQDDGYGSIKQQKPKVLSVIDGRRAQNCNILLSKLKLTNQEISKAMMTMDTAETIPKDMLEQLLKFVPTPEEVSLLKEHEGEVNNMARADRFLYEMSKIIHYEQRLKCLYFKKKFQERMGECKPKVEAVLKACKEVHSSKKLRRLLEVVLVFGNYMNRGARGNASGFKISSLNKIIDTKSSIQKNITLLHYLLEMLEKKFPDVFKLEDEMPNVPAAARVNMPELEKDMMIISSGLKELERELEFQRNKTNQEKGDKFVSVMGDFKTVSSISFNKLQDLLAEAKEKYIKVAKMFGENPTSVSVEEFFGIFDVFLNSFGEAKMDNINLRKKREEEEKRAKMEQERLEKEKIRKASKRANQKGGEGEFDDLVSALRNGEVFGDDIAAKMNRKLRKTSQQNNSAVPAMKNGDSRERLGRRVGPITKQPGRSATGL